ncbi:MAG TPA: hypothetical protein VD866_02335 [Urbifossiella sp.]|nr:hypothetical protein [Urbifossiella sp.]
MAKKPAVDADALVTQALLTVATADHPPRLAGKGDTPALFAGKTGPNKTAIDALTAAGGPLVTVSGKGADEAVRLTRAGFERVAGQLPEDRVGAVAKSLAAGLPTAERVAFLQDVVSRSPVAAAELQSDYEAAVVAEKAEAEARLKESEARRAREERAKQAMVRWLELDGQRKQQRVATLLAELRAEGWTEAAGGPGPVVPLPPPPPPREPQPRLQPQTREDADFRRDLAERLVSSWRDAVQYKKNEARGFLETAMDNLVGLTRVGEEGDEVPFDGAVHEAVPGVFTDHPVRVTRSGWALEEDADREYVIQKAQVAKL